MEGKDKALPWQGDEFEGQGGSFVYDPKTKTRTRVQENALPAAAEGGQANTGTAADSVRKSKKE
jgi:hypothetical protein